MSMRLRAALAATLALAGQPVFAQQWPAEPVRIDIAAQPIADALNEWARQTGFQLLLPEEGLAAGVIAPKVEGSLAPRAALERLLAGSGLTYEHTADRAIIVRPAGQANGSTTNTRDSNIIEEVNVVGVIDFQQNDAFGATKMGMPVAETPFSMLVVTNDLMRTASVKKTSDLYKLDPSGGTNNRMGGYGRAFARGYAVPVYMDGFRQSVEADLDYAAFDRLELVKGGTSTLYGQNEPGGVLNYVSKVPQTVSAIQLKAEAGTDSFYRGELDVTGPIFDSDRWSWRAILAQQKDDTYQDFGQDDSYAAISSLMYRGERATFLLRAHFEEQEMKYSNGLAVQLDAPIPTGYTWDSAIRAGLIGLKLVDDVPRSRAFGPQSQRKKIFLTQAQFDYRFESNWKLRTNVQSSRGDDFINLTLVQGPLDFDGRNRIQYQSPGRLKDEDYSLEVNLFGDFELLGRTHTLFFGVDYSNSTTVGWTGTANL
ncbi:TonB-dependent siderophore receptor, partial [Steroidobacter sp.]|uniref:TonB-dependent siderophore receptor n=1 Tax=Steroidobacter sp. TaxID=1978227 RepID=UPI001A617D85